MSSNAWIESSGLCRAEDVPSLLTQYGAAHGESKYIALYTNRTDSGFCTGSALTPTISDIKHLLEVRLFNNDSELWLHRSSMAAPFAYRTANDTLMQDLPDMTIVKTQKLDIAAGSETPYDEYGRVVHRTATGGSYTLPTDAADDETVLRVYLTQNRFGALGQADWRIVGFRHNKTEEQA